MRTKIKESLVRENLQFQIDYSVVIPLYNEAGNIRQLVESVIPVMNSLYSAYEIILVDDGSNDGTKQNIQQLIKEYPVIRLLKHCRNLGQSAALLTGFRAAKGKVLITMDGDGQYDPQDLFKMLALLEEFDVVVGVRAGRRQDGYLKILYSKLTNQFRRWLLKDSFRDIGCNFRVFNGECLNGLPYFDGFHRFLPVLMMADGYSVKEIEITHRKRRYGVSKYTMRNRLLKSFIDCLIVRQFIYNKLPAFRNQEKSPL